MYRESASLVLTCEGIPVMMVMHCEWVSILHLYGDWWLLESLEMLWHAN